MQTVTGKPNATLSDGLKYLERSGAPVHSALTKGWTLIYGWSSDAEGIRHALADEPNVGLREALYMLVSCSAFVSYLIGTEVDGSEHR